MAMESSSKQKLGLMGILAKSSKIRRENAWLMAPLTLLAMSNSLMLLGKLMSQIPLITDALSDLSLVQIKDPGINLLFLQLLIKTKSQSWRISIDSVIFELLMFCSINVFFMVASIYATALAYTGRKSPISFKDLLLMSKTAWPRTMLTWAFLTFGLTLVVAPIGTGFLWVLVAAVGSINKHSCLVVLLGGVVLIMLLLALCLMLYLDLVLALAVVISVVEEENFGAKVIGKAEEVIRGRRLQGLATEFVLHFLGLVLSAPLGFFMVNHSKMPLEAQLTIGLFVINFKWVVSLIFGTIVHTVFYCECNKRHGDSLVFEDQEMQGLMGDRHVPSP